MGLGRRLRVGRGERLIPRQRDRQSLEQAADAVQDWLEVQQCDDCEPLIDDEAEDLHRISVLAIAGASEAELNKAVRRARQSGWGWGPIAMLLGETREQARQRASMKSRS